MDFFSIVAFISKYVDIQYGVVIVAFGVYVIIHKKQHEKTDGIITEKLNNLIDKISNITSIEKKIDKYIWTIEGDEAKKINEFLGFVFSEEKCFMSKAHIELRDFIRDIHDFNKSKDDYYMELADKVFEMWELQREKFETQVDPTYMRKFAYVSNILTPIVREHVRSIVDIVLDKTLNGSREKTVDAYLLNAFTSISNIWEGLIEQEIKKDLLWLRN